MSLVPCPWSLVYFMEAFIFLLILFLGLLAGLAWYRFRDSRYLKKPTKEAMSKALRSELEKEAEDAERRKKRFAEELKKFGL